MDISLINSELDKIIGSPTFLKAESAKQLLTYLTKTTTEGSNIKEYKIADEVFHKDSDTGVRAYVHNLRKKLDEYYQNEGKDDNIIFSIPKGQYFVKFEERKKRIADKVIINFLTRNKIVAFGALLAIIIGSITIIKKVYFTEKLHKTVVWGDILNPKEKLLLVVGDNYFYGALVATGSQGVMRDFKINSQAEFDSAIDTLTELKKTLQKINYSYLTKQGVTSVFSIVPYFTNLENISLVLSSELQNEDIKQKNILFFGKYNTLGLLNQLVYNKHYNIDSRKNLLNFIYKDSVIIRNIIIDNIKNEDYAVVIRYKTPYGKTIMLFVAVDDSGEMATINYFLNYKNVKMLEKTIGLTKNDDSFKALFKITSIGRTDFSIEYVAGQKLE